MPQTPPAGWEHLTLHVFAGSAESVLYEDAGEGWGFRQGEFRLSRFATTWQEGVLRIRREVGGTESIGSRRWEVVVHGLPAPAQEVLVDGQGSACAWDAEHKVLRLETAPFREIEIRV
jgi:alpha-glucosidase